MYEKFYGLKEVPFNLTPDPSFLFLSKRSKDALDLILYAIERREGFVLIVGDVGTGKTTLSWALLERLARKKICTALIQNPMLSEIDILRTILQDLGVRPEGAGKSNVFDTEWMQSLDKKQLLDRLNKFLLERVQDDIFTVLIIDEAQNMPATLLEQLRLISNFETAKKKLLQIIFIGQLELNQKLKLSSMRQLNQRISVRFETKTLSLEDTENYIRHRLAIAEATSKLRFGIGVFKAVWRYSKGYPRLINLTCDRALLAGYMDRSLVITRNHIKKAVLGLQGKSEDESGLFGKWVRKKAVWSIPIVVLLIAVFFWVYRGSAINLVNNFKKLFT
jgi:general secretion pathway protein A